VSFAQQPNTFALAITTAPGIAMIGGSSSSGPGLALFDGDRNILTSLSIAPEAGGYRDVTYADGFSALDGFKVRNDE
jgi:hypothetical protein